MQSLCQGKGQRSHKAKNRRKHFHGQIGPAISNLVGVLVSELWAMAIGIVSIIVLSKEESDLDLDKLSLTPY